MVVEDGQDPLDRDIAGALIVVRHDVAFRGALVPVAVREDGDDGHAAQQVEVAAGELLQLVQHLALAEVVPRRHLERILMII